jgi:hypothetical protein
MIAKLQGGAVLVDSTDGGTVVRCQCCCPPFVLDSAGGDAGYSETFQLQKRGRDYEIFVTFNAFFVADSLNISTNLGTLYDTGCIGEEIKQPSSASETLTITNQMSSISVSVSPLCGAITSGTAWVLFIDGLCVKEQAE